MCMNIYASPSGSYIYIYTYVFFSYMYEYIHIPTQYIYIYSKNEGTHFHTKVRELYIVGKVTDLWQIAGAQLGKGMANIVEF